MKFSNLHTHGNRSHDGAGNAIDRCEYILELGQTHFAGTDHGVMTGHVEAEREAKKRALLYIPGCEVYFQPQFKPVKGESRYHCTVLTKTYAGYQSLMAMMTHAAQAQTYYVPIVTLDDFRASKDLIVLSGCMSSYLAKMILAADIAAQEAYVEAMGTIFGEDFYLEVQPFHVPPMLRKDANKQWVVDPDTDVQERINTRTLALAQQYGINVVMTADAHYVRPEDFDLYKLSHTLRKRGQDMLADYSKRSLHSAASMHAAWLETMGSDGTAYIEESQRIAEKCDVTIERKIQMPKLPGASVKQLRIESEVRLARKLKKAGRLDATGAVPAQYMQRLSHELHIFEQKGFADYIWLCADIADFCRCENIFMSARGSGCGSLVLYALGVSLVDPLAYRCSFERFLSPSRSDWPDVDVDIASHRRQEVFDYIFNLLPGHAAYLGSYGMWKGRSLANGLASHFQMSSIDAEALGSIHSTYEDLDEAEAIDLEAMLAKPVLEELEHDYPGVLRAYEYFHGEFSYMGQHACGVVITNDAIEASIPLMLQPTTKRLITSYNKGDVEYVGAMKLDLLGVNALRQITIALETCNQVFSEDWITNPVVYESLGRGETLGVFQLGRKKARDMLRDARKAGKLNSVEDVAAINAINRPVPLEMGSFKIFATGKGGNPFLAPYTQDSNGALIYQEQVMSICHDLAGMDWPSVDKVLKMLKRWNENNITLQTLFVDGCKEKNMTESDALILWHHLRRYLFNKSHAVAYALIAIIQVYIRTYYPFAWFWSLLKTEKNEEKRLRYEADAVRHKVHVLPAHVNGGLEYEELVEPETGRRALIRGLSSIPDIGKVTADAIYKERMRNGDYTSAQDVLRRIPKRILNSKRVQVLHDYCAIEFDENLLTKYRCELAQELRGTRTYEY